MTYEAIFDDVTSILNTDYSGYQDKMGWGRPEIYKQRLLESIDNDAMDDTKFERFVSEYLMDYKDGHMFFRGMAQNKIKNHIGFSVRRYKDMLYVTEVFNDHRLSVGDAIGHIGGHDLDFLEREHHSIVNFAGDLHERQKWHEVFKVYPSFRVIKKDGSCQEFELCCYEAPTYTPEYSLKTLENGMLLLTLTDFMDADAVNALLKEHHNTLLNCKGLVVDVRVNRGGSDSTYFELLKYLFNETISMKALDDEVMQINFTERTCKLRKETFETHLLQSNDPQVQVFLKAFLKELEDNWCKGLVDSTMMDDMEDLLIEVYGNPKQIVVLSDTFCGSSGDAFVEVCNKSDKVMTMGRPSAGITDYSNLAVQEYDGRFRFMYPTSRTCSIDKGNGISGKGHPVKVYIPWTPEHLSRDVDLESAINLIKEHF